MPSAQTLSEIVSSINPQAQKSSFTFKSNDERDLHAFVNRDVLDMQEYAKPAREAARDGIIGYNALVLGSTQKDKLFPPTIHTIVHARISMEAASLPHVEYRSRTEGGEGLIKFINAAKRNAEEGDGVLRPDAHHLWFHQTFDKILFGTGFRYLSYLFQQRIVHVKDEQGKWREKRMTVYDDIWDEVPDFFHVGVSRDMLPGMFGGRACYMDKFYPRDVFKEVFDTPFYENMGKVPEFWFEGDSDVKVKVPEKTVRVRFYWDLCKDLYYVQANGVPIRKDYILDYGPFSRPQKFLPITSIHNDTNFTATAAVPGFTNVGINSAGSNVGGRIYGQSIDSSTSKSFWSLGDAQLVRGLVALKRALWNAAANHIKSSSIHFLLAQNTGVLDQIRSSDLYGIVPLKTDGSAFNVQSLTQGSVFLKEWTGMDQVIDDLMTSALGTDWRKAAAELTNEKATVAAIRQQVQRIRLKSNMNMNETGGIKRHYRILLNLIEQYYSEPSLVEIEGDVPEGVEEEDIIRDRDGHPIQYKKYKRIPIDEKVVEVKRDGKFRIVSADTVKDREYEQFFRARPEYLVSQEEPETYVESGSTFAELAALERSLELDFLTAVTPFFSMVYPDDQGVPTPLIPKEGAEYVLEKLADVWDRDAKKLLGKNEGEDMDVDKMLAPFEFPSTEFQQPAVPQQLPTAGGLPGRATPALTGNVLSASARPPL